MTEQGVVLSVKKEFAKVRIERNSACASCGKCGMTEKQKHVDFYASNAVGATVGDTVSLDIPETNSARLALVGYFLPLVPALGFMFLAVGLNWAEWLAAVLFFVGLAVGFAIVALVDKLRKHKWMETPVILEILHKVNTEQTVAQQSTTEQTNTEQADIEKGESKDE